MRNHLALPLTLNQLAISIAGVDNCRNATRNRDAARGA